MVRQREIDVVAAKKQMVPHCDSFNIRRHRSASTSDLEKAEIGGTAADINDEYMISAIAGNLLPEPVRTPMLLQPIVKCCLSFLQQADSSWKTSLRRGVQSKSLCGCIERCWNRGMNLLFVNTGALVGELRIPTGAKVFE